jgi:hypothetical protein
VSINGEVAMPHRVSSPVSGLELSAGPTGPVCVFVSHDTRSVLWDGVLPLCPLAAPAGLRLPAGVRLGRRVLPRPFVPTLAGALVRPLKQIPTCTRLRAHCTVRNFVPAQQLTELCHRGKKKCQSVAQF